MSNMKRWTHENAISYAQLASQLNQSKANITQKVNGNTNWQYRDFVTLKRLYGLSSDFVQGLIPYEAEFNSPANAGPSSRKEVLA